jgi:hypothetical protein
MGRQVARRKSSAPTWWTVKGDLIHRCALAAAGKWLSIEDAASLCEDEPVLMYEARWVADQLKSALSGDLDAPNPARNLAWALVDSGGPYWMGRCEDFRSLKEADRLLVLHGGRYVPEGGQERFAKGLTELSLRVAGELLDEAEEDNWRFMLSEIFNPFAFLDAARRMDDSGTPEADRREGYRKARKRIDLLVQRKLKPPLIVDLKTSRYPATSAHLDDMVNDIAREYGEPAAQAYGKDIQCRILHVSFDGHIDWSDLMSVFHPDAA